MRKTIKAKDAVYPMPVLMIAAYNDEGKVEIMNAACGMMIAAGKVVLKVSKPHKTVKCILKKGAFTVSIPDADHVTEADYFGVVSGNDTPDKFANSGHTATKAELVDAPVINEFPLCMECEVIDYQDGEDGLGLIGRIVNATADEGVMDGDRLDMSLVNAIAFDPYTQGYYRVSERVGDAFKDGFKLKK